MKYYAGIGSRSTPADVCGLMTRLARLLRDTGFNLRSGRAAGADQAFEEGAGNKAVIYLPWESFRKKPYRGDLGYKGAGGLEVVISEEQADRNWAVLKEHGIVDGDARKTDGPVVRLHGRNVWQVTGHKPETLFSEFVLFWAPEKDGVVEGGTRTAVYLARRLGIKTYNLYDPAVRARFEKRLESTEF